jgi:hypothetical protein
MGTKPTYTIAAISGTEGRSEMIQRPIFSFIHPFRLVGSGGDVWMTRLARSLKAPHGWWTLELLSTRAQHSPSLLSR